MKNLVVALVLAIVALALPYPTQATSAPAGIPGYYNAATGTFSPLTIKQVPLAAVVSRTGTFEAVITLTIESAIGIDEPITCTASISSFDPSFTNSASATGLVVRTGATGKVTITIPYDWTMAATGESATVSVNCSESEFGTGSAGHSMSFAGFTFTVPTTAGTVTIKDLTASL
ncbi:MAG TPA: hypothetical protein VGY99_24180 [Candidatus Binataceae bacterium]|jgi:hypothetical protein|nr:hypothetical protein [Candidatus Binataceae bacterium]